ncbi:hypothetical protein EKS39_14375 [Enterobacter roggenkampii]|nr:hypothetical protein EKS39_14375 [Enterobacter roggenkampii]RTY37907.1 hypothetical protein EKS40_20475 [Enterobacter roggenkampii]
MPFLSPLDPAAVSGMYQLGNKCGGIDDWYGLIRFYQTVCEPFGEFTAMIKLLNCFTQLLMNDFALFD